MTLATRLDLRSLGVALSAALAAPLSASAQEVTAPLGTTAVPVGPPGTTVRAQRVQVLGERYVVLETRSPADPSRCALPPERVSAWWQSPTGWTEIMNDVFDRCPAAGATQPMVVRAAMVEWHNGASVQPELHVRVTDPLLPPDQAPLVRYRRVGDRWTNGRREATLASRPGEAPQATLAAAPAINLDGDLGDWRGVAPWVQGDGAAGRAEVWLAAQGERLYFAARIASRGPDHAPVFTLTLGEPGVSTASLRGVLNNHARTITVRCGSGDAQVRCGRDGDATTIEGETDLGTMVWAARSVGAVSALAVVAWGEGAQVSSDDGARLHPLALPRPFDLLAGAVPEAARACARAPYRTRTSVGTGAAAVEGAVACGASCRDGVCEQTVVTRGAGTRLAWVGAAGATSADRCMTVLGEGANDFRACQGPGGDTVRLVGQVPARGFELVVAVDRAVRRGTDTAHRAEIWALVTRSARWQLLWQGADVEDAPAEVTTVRMEGSHPTLCRGEGPRDCELADSLTLVPPGDGTAVVAAAHSRHNAGIALRSDGDTSM